MIILTQKKNIVVNLNNARKIEVVKNHKGNYLIYAVFEETEQGYENLGSYATEERVSEVLNDMFNKINEAKYVMPEE